MTRYADEQDHILLKITVEIVLVYHEIRKMFTKECRRTVIFFVRYSNKPQYSKIDSICTCLQH